MPSIAMKTIGSFEQEQGLGYLANSLTDYTEGTGHELSLPAEFVAAAKASEPDDPSARPDLLDALHLAVALGHAFALARMEEPFAAEGDLIATAKAEGLEAAVRHYVGGEAVSA